MSISHDKNGPNHEDPGSGNGGPDHPRDQPPAGPPGIQDESDTANVEEPIGNDNIREGRVRGVMGGPRAQEGEGGGG